MRACSGLSFEVAKAQESVTAIRLMRERRSSVNDRLRHSSQGLLPLRFGQLSPSAMTRRWRARLPRKPPAQEGQQKKQNRRRKVMRQRPHLERSCRGHSVLEDHFARHVAENTAAEPTRSN
jgi:hypothetical protein